MTVTERHKVLTALYTSRDRVSAWRDNAVLMTQRCAPIDESRWKNERDNYAYLSQQLSIAIEIIDREN